jgi:osmotically-inducible protein OsmY
LQRYKSVQPDKVLRMRLQSIAAGVFSIALLTGGLAGCAGGPSRSPEATVSDAALTTKVKAALINEPGVDALAINVDTYGGVVSLRGTVRDRAMAARAVDVARRVSGVRSVDDRLEALS